MISNQNIIWEPSTFNLQHINFLIYQSRNSTFCAFYFNKIIDKIQDIVQVQYFNIDKLLTEIKKHIKQNLNRIILIPILFKENQNIQTIISNNGIKDCIKSFASQNIYTKIDILTIQLEKYSLLNVALKFIQNLAKPNISSILHGAIIKFSMPQLLSLQKIQDSYIIVTGGSKGIGKSISKQLASLGKKIIITGRPGNKELIQYAKQLSTNHKTTVHYQFLELKDKDSCQQLALRMFQKGYKIQGLIHNAAVGTKTSQQQASINESCQEILIKVNLIGPYYLQNSIQKQQLLLKQAKILFISSVSALRPFKQMNPIDDSTKFMLDIYADQIKKRYNVLRIYPGATNTQMFQKSVLNNVIKADKYQEFLKNLPKQMIINPEDIGYIVGLFFKDQFSQFLNEQQISACCGLHFDYRDLPSV